jgi:hypothetical protein
VVTNLSTGFDNATGSLLPTFTVDPKYQVTGPDGLPYYPQARSSSVPGALPDTYIKDAALPGSLWDYLTTSPTSHGPDFVPVGNFVFHTTVDLTGFDPATAVIHGLKVSTDNAFLSVAVNGVTVFSRTPTGDILEEFTSVLDVGALVGDLGHGAFHAGLNTVDFTILNQGFGGDGSTIPSPSAFRASATVEASPAAAAVPEPPTVALLGLGAAAVAGWRWRARKPVIAQVAPTGPPSWARRAGRAPSCWAVDAILGKS